MLEKEFGTKLSLRLLSFFILNKAPNRFVAIRVAFLTKKNAQILPVLREIVKHKYAKCEQLFHLKHKRKINHMANRHTR